jgi:hypothetical protein
MYSQSGLLTPQQHFALYGRQHHFFHQIMEYISYLDANSDKVRIEKYGETYQGRPMYLVYISSPQNLANLENIRQSHLHTTGMLETAPQKKDEKAVVWCSFGVHGNEAGATESVPQIVYDLISGADPRADQWLSNTVVILDPSLNPDGFDRYVHFLKSASGQRIHPETNHREHMEPWPTGRYNHYLFDMNRDWAWQTQKETQARIAAYNRWLPHVHADFHEMGYNNHYYFAPAVEPYHAFLTPFQRQFQTEIGQSHGNYFDQKGWLYWTREVFDLFYPSYGDTYPCYSGAIGMTYEQGGNSSSGRAILMNNGDTLTIQDKIDHNTIVALSTIEVSSKNADRLRAAFSSYYAESVKNPRGKFKTYILKDAPALSRLAALFDRSGIRYAWAGQQSRLTAYHYQSGQSRTFDVQKGDMVIQSAQPRSVLLQVLMEEEAALKDSVTYDITAWTLPFAYQIDCYAFTEATSFKTSQTKPVDTALLDSEGPIVAFQVPWNDLNSARLLAALHKDGYKVRMAMKEASYQGKPVQKGSLIIHKGDNPWKKQFEAEIKGHLRKSGVEGWRGHSSGFSDYGGDFGGHQYHLLHAPKVLTLAGRGVQANSCGEIWYYFDQLLDYDLSVVEIERFDRIDLTQYNTLILPDGYYGLEENQMAKISDWVKSGGRVIAIDGAIQQFQDKSGLSMDTYATEDDKKKAEEAADAQALASRLNDYQGSERRNISKTTAGAIVYNAVDDSHPLGFGLGKSYFSLKTSSAAYALQKGAWNVLHVPQNYRSFGFIGNGLKGKLSGSVSFAAKAYGNGQAIFMVDNPLFRCFWDRGLLLFSNALFLNGTLDENY